MAYTTANSVTTDPASGVGLVKVQDYDDSFAGASQVRLDTLLRRAERRVKDIAPPAGTPTDEYRAAARDAELLAFDYLFKNPGYLESHSVLDESVSYAKGDALTRIISETMGGFVLEQYSAQAANTGYAGWLEF